MNSEREISYTTRINEERHKLHREVRERTAGYIAGALGFVAGLAWNDAVKALIEHFFPLSKNTLLAKFGYAIVITVVVVFVTIYVVRMISGKQEQK